VPEEERVVKGLWGGTASRGLARLDRRGKKKKTPQLPTEGDVGNVSSLDTRNTTKKGTK